MKHQPLIFALLLLFLTQGYGQIEVESIEHSLDLVGNSEVKVLKINKDIPFKDVLRISNWKPFDSTYFSESKAIVWLQFEIKNKFDVPFSFYLLAEEQYVTVRQQNQDEFIHLENGYFLPRKHRANKSYHYFTPIEIPPNSTSHFYISLQNHPSTRNSHFPKLYSESAYVKYTEEVRQSQSIAIIFEYFYIITILTILVFTLVFYLRMGHKLYLYYMGYLLFQLIYGFIILRNTLAQVGNFFENYPLLAYNLNEPVQFMFIGFYILFISHLLTIRKYDPILDRALFYFGISCFVYALFKFFMGEFFFDAQISSLIFTAVRLIIFPLNIILLFWIIFKVRHPLLNYFIIGQVCFFTAALIASYIGFKGIKFFPGAFFEFRYAPNFIFQMGLILEVYCFSMALGENVFLLQREKEKANDALITQLKTNHHLQEQMNLELDEKVQEKTEELIKLYSELELEREKKIKDEFDQKIKETKMVALRSQMNPHFIFNSLSAIKDLIMSARNEDAIHYLDDFSRLLREILQNSNRQKITVEEELEIMELYLSIERKRMGESFRYSIKVDSKEELSQYDIPPLLLQPIVENAIWHGLKPSPRPEKTLNVIFDTSEVLKIIIEDNGIGRKESGKKKRLYTSMGTQIVQDRITLFNHLNDHFIHLRIDDLEEKGIVLGTRITLTYKY